MANNLKLRQKQFKFDFNLGNTIKTKVGNSEFHIPIEMLKDFNLEAVKGNLGKDAEITEWRRQFFKLLNSINILFDEHDKINLRQTLKKVENVIEIHNNEKLEFIKQIESLNNKIYYLANEKSTSSEFLKSIQSKMQRFVQNLEDDKNNYL